MSYNETILRQYSGLPKIYQMIDTFDQAVSMDDFEDSFIDDVWDVLTAGTYGLDVWGKIVGIGRYVTGSTDNPIFGFEAESDTSQLYRPFNTYPFYSGENLTNNIRLENDAYRTLILAKAFSNISLATIPEINRFLTILFKGRGRAYCANYQGMTIGITVEFKLFTFENNLLQNFNVMPIPSGVNVTITRAFPKKFGFADGFYPFNEGTFPS